MRTKGAVALLLALLGCGAPSPPPAPAPPATTRSEPVVAPAPSPAPPVPTTEQRPRALPTGQPDRGAPIAGPARGELTTLGRHPSQGAVMIGPRVVNLSEDFLRLSGIDATTGQPIWTVPLPGHPGGQHILQRLGQRVMLRRQGDLIVIDPATGRTVARHQLHMGDRRFMHEVRGVCFMNGSCGAQLIDCDDARPLGSLLRGQRINFHPLPVGGGPGGGGGDSCFGFNLQPLGRSGDLLVYSVRGMEPSGPPPPGKPKKPLFAGDAHLAALDVTTGKLRYQRDPGCGHCTETSSGITPDGRTGWFAREEQLEIFDVATGRPRHTRRFHKPIAFALWVVGDAPGLFVVTEDEVAMLPPFSGLRWRRKRAGTTILPMVDGALVTPLSHHQLQMGAEHLAWLDPATGAERSRGQLDEDEVLLPAADGTATLVAEDDERDAGGQVIEGARRLRLEVKRGRRPDSGTGPSNQAALIERRSGAALLTLDHDAWTVGEWSATADSPNRFIALFEHDPDPAAPGAVRVMRLAPSTP